METSLLQAAMQQTYWLAANYFSTGRNTPPLGTAHSLIAPYQVFQAQDGGMVIGGGNPNAWRRICEVLGHPEWQEDERFNHPQRRVQHRAELEQLINEVLAGGTVSYWCEQLDEAGVPCGPLNTAGQALEHPQTRAIGMVMDVSDGQGSTELELGLPVTLNQTPSNHATSCAPQVGEHSHAVLKEFGFSDQEITELQEAQVISQH